MLPDRSISYVLSILFLFIIIFKDKSLINEKNQEIGNNCFGGSKRLVLILNDQFKAFSINLNAQHVNGMTHF